ncbi:stable inheritance protein KleA [Xanthomonas citri]|uniref:stable inheritance protein KleA n=1 Tax=Xanthomonas citri TaxID=346 RepID=UPI001F333212|nr:stable inheritance protein KleA [Xanthomonas citri]
MSKNKIMGWIDALPNVEGTEFQARRDAITLEGSARGTGRARPSSRLNAAPAGKGRRPGFGRVIQGTPRGDSPISKIEIIETCCPRCGKSIRTLGHSIIGADDAREKFGNICGDCITPEEDSELTEMLLAAVARRMSGVTLQ